jgi:Flp pilus assembly protein TadD
MNDDRARPYPLSFAQVQLLLDTGRAGQALAALERAVAAHPDRPDGHSDLAVLYCSLGRLDDAARACRRAVELDPASRHARETRAAIARAIGASA